MEISEEDVNSSSLIKQKYPQSQSSLISSSPLIRTRSSEKPSNNKENVYSNNVEVPNLGMKPMQMKSRRKGGGYNLRKSLAWDTAFFTDEGILDPLELTLITGINANTSRGELATISEQGNSSDSNFGNDSNEYDDAEPSEEALCKELHDTTRTSRGNRKKTDSSLRNHGSSPHPKVAHKVLSVNRTKRAGSKVGGCSEPLAASSLKRPANSSIMRTAKKESKLPKMPISKPEPCLSAMTKGSIAPSHLRHNPIPKPTIDAKKNVAFKSYAKNVHEHDSQSKAKMSSGSVHLPTKELAKRTIRNLTKSSSKATSSTKSCLVRADRPNSGSDMVPDRLQLCKCEEESEPLVATNLAQQTTTNADNSLPGAAMSISSGHCHNQRASNGPMISNRLHSFKSQEHPAALVPHHVNPNNAGVPSHIRPAGPSGLRLPSPSLRFFDQKTTSECGSLKQKKFEQLNTNMGSNRKIGVLRPPAVPARTPMKINDIKENPCSAPSTLSTPSGSTQLSLSPKHVENTTNVVPVSNIYTNLARKMVDIKVEYEGRGSELESHKVVEQDKRSFGLEEIKENEKTSHSTVQLEEGTGVTIHLSQNAGYNEVGVGTLQLMPEGNDERVPFFSETKDKHVLHIEEDRLHSYTAISMLKSPQSIQHEHNLLTTSTDFREDIAQVSGEQSHIEKSDALKVNPKSCFDACSLEAEDWVSEVFVDSLKEQIEKREDNVGPDLERHSYVLQHENIGQENDVAKAVDNKNILMNDDARWNIDSSCGGTTGRISITSRDFIVDIAQTSREQSETEKSDASKGNPGSQLGVGSLEAEDRVGEVFVDLQDESGKKEDNVDTGLKNSAVLQDENVGQDKDVAKAVVDKSLTMKFDARWNTDCPCSGTKERSSITTIDFMQDIAKTSGEQSDVEKSDASMVNSESIPDNGSLEAEDWVSQVFVDSQTDHTGKREDDAYVGLVKYSTVLQQETIGQEDDAAKAVDDKSLPMKDDARWNTDSPGSGTMEKISITPRESPKDEGENGGNTVATKSRYQFHSEGPSVSCIMPSESSALDRGPYTNATEIFQDKSGSSYLGAIFLEVPDEKQDVKPLAEDLEYREAAPLIDDHKQFSLLCTRPGVELLSGTASLGDAESILQVAQYGSTYLTNLEKEGLDIIPAATEAEHQVHEDQKNQVMGIITGSFSEESIVAENLQHSHDNILEANPNFQITEGSVAINNFSKTHVEDSQLHLLDVEMLVQSCSTLTSELHCHSKQDVDHSDIFGKQPELSSTGIELEKVSRSNQLLNNTINFQQDVKDVVGRSDAYECDPKPSNIDAPTPTLGQEVGFQRNSEGQPCVESITSGSTVIDSAANCDGNCNDRQLKECADLLLEFESSGKDKMFGVDITRMGYYSPLEEQCSFPREIVDSMLQEKETFFGEFAEIEQVSADYDGVCMDSSSSEKISNSNKANNALDSVDSEQSISYGCNVQTSCASVQNLPLVQVNVYDVTGGNKPNEPQGFDEIMPLMDTSDPFKNGQSNSSFTVSQQPNTGVTTTSTTVCSVTAELCSDAGRNESMLTSTYRIGDEGSKVNIGDEIDAGVFQVGRISMADELHHDLDSGGNLERNKDTTVLSKKPNDIKRQDNSLFIHPPNAVPFSDEWLAAIEAAGEEILTMKCGAVQHSPPDKSLPEPSPWSPVKKKVNQIGPYDCTKYTNAMPSNPH